MEQILIAVVPFILSFVTGVVKQLPTLSDLRQSRKPAIRAVAALVSLIFVIAMYWATDAKIDPTQFTDYLTLFVMSFIAWLSTLGWYHATKK